MEADRAEQEQKFSKILRAFRITNPNVILTLQSDSIPQPNVGLAN